MNFVPRFYQTEAIDSVQPLEGRKLIVIPTGGGKSYIAGRLASDSVMFVGRVLVLVHVKELVEQDAEAILKADMLADMGIICAGIDPRELSDDLIEYLGRLDADITVASVQSVYKKLQYWDDIGLIIVDEAHRITPVGGKLYTAVFKRFPDVPVVGLTATPFRMGTGYLHKGDNALFDAIAYEISHAELVELGYLVPFANKGSDLAYDDEKLKKVGGEFSQASLAKLTKDGAKTRKIVSQFVQRARERNHWLVFAMSVRHAKMIKEFLAEEGIEAGIIYDDMHKDGLSRDDEIALFKMGIYRALINVNVLTTGFDFPALDCVVLCRPIASPVLFIQCIGRGTRLSPDTGKMDCLVLDYGGNVARHGDFSSPDITPVKKSKKRKECENCGERNTTGARQCAACGHKFIEMFKKCPSCQIFIDRSAQECTKGFQIVTVEGSNRYQNAEGCGHTWPVNEINLDEDGKTVINNSAIWVDLETWKAKATTPFVKAGEEHRPDYVLITYKGIDGVTFKEYIFPESHATRPKFSKFWIEHHRNGSNYEGDRRKDVYNIPGSSGETDRRWKELRMPRRVKVIRQGKYYNILAREF